MLISLLKYVYVKNRVWNQSCAELSHKRITIRYRIKKATRPQPLSISYIIIQHQTAQCAFVPCKKEQCSFERNQLVTYLMITWVHFTSWVYLYCKSKGVWVSADLSCSQDNGSELRAVTPLSEERECKRLDKDRRNKIMPFPRRQHGRRRPRLYIRSAIGQLVTLKLEKTHQSIGHLNSAWVKRYQTFEQEIVPHLLIFLLNLSLHLLELLLAFVRAHPQPFSQHPHPEDGKQHCGDVVGIDPWDDRGGVSKED